MLHLTDQLTAYLDGALTPEEAATVAAHLAECPECRGTLDDLQAVRNLLRTVSAQPPHPALLPRTFARLEHVQAQRSVPRWLIATATTVAGLILLLQLRLPAAPLGNRVSALWYFQQHAAFAAVHPMADVTLTSYLSSVLPYEIFPEWPAAQKTP
jgi:anti-sigma factor RsiW